MKKGSSTDRKTQRKIILPCQIVQLTVLDRSGDVECSSACKLFNSALTKKSRFSTMKKNYDVLQYKMLLIGILLDFNATGDQIIPQKRLRLAEILIFSVTRVIESVDN